MYTAWSLAPSYRAFAPNIIGYSLWIVFKVFVISVILFASVLLQKFRHLNLFKNVPHIITGSKVAVEFVYASMMIKENMMSFFLLVKLKNGMILGNGKPEYIIWTAKCSTKFRNLIIDSQA